MAINGIFGGNTLGRKSVAFGTAINRLVPPFRGKTTRISKMVATAAGTAHTVTVMRSIGRTKVTTAAAASATAITVDAINGTLSPTGNNLAGSDLVAFRETDGVTRQYTVSSVSGNVITLSAGLTAGVAAQADVWNFGVAGDTDPKTGEAHMVFTVPASATTTFSDDSAGVAASNLPDEPLLLQQNNATATGTIEQVSYGYTNN